MSEFISVVVDQLEMSGVTARNEPELDVAGRRIIHV